MRSAAAAARTSGYRSDGWSVRRSCTGMMLKTEFSGGGGGRGKLLAPPRWATGRCVKFMVTETTTLSVKRLVAIQTVFEGIELVTFFSFSLEFLVVS